MPTGLVKSMIQASGACVRIFSAMSSTTGTVRSALASPPAPVVSWPTQPHSRGSVSSTLRAAWPPMRSCSMTACAPATPSSTEVVARTVAGCPAWASIRRAIPADQLQPVDVRVDQRDLGEGKLVAQPCESVDQLRRVRRAAPDNGEFHPFTPVSVTPSMKTLWAKKNTMITGAVTSRVAAMVRFHCTLCSARKDASPTESVQSSSVVLA